MDPAALKESWALVAKSGDEVPMFFYSHLFVSHPELRPMFPISMATQRDRLVGALGRIVSNADQLDEVVGFIQQLGRDHRRFSVVTEHYAAVGASLLATLKHFLGAAWTPELAADWSAAYGLIANTMVQAAEAAAEETPDWWEAEVLSVERRTLDLAVIKVQTNDHLPYRAGQSMAVEVPQRPRLWRYLTPANAPKDNGVVEFHVQLVDGGQVSTSIVRHLKPGDQIKMGAAIGDQLTRPEDRDRDLLMVAGGSGLAPLRAVLEEIDVEYQATGAAPKVHLLHGVRVPWNLYEHQLLTWLSQRDWFSYTPVVSDDQTYPGRRGLVGTVAARDAEIDGRLAMVCGSPGMVQHTVTELTEAGLPPEQIRYENFETHAPEATSATATVTPAQTPLTGSER
ncbi:MAG: oxidoreductase [Nocardioides sp.]|nr:oxidoreductase [Nocardioides sp.]